MVWVRLNKDCTAKYVSRNQSQEVSEDGALGTTTLEDVEQILQFLNGTQYLFLCLETQQVMNDGRKKGKNFKRCWGPRCCPGFFPCGVMLLLTPDLGGTAAKAMDHPMEPGQTLPSAVVKRS